MVAEFIAMLLALHMQEAARNADDIRRMGAAFAEYRREQLANTIEQQRAAERDRMADRKDLPRKPGSFYKHRHR